MRYNPSGPTRLWITILAAILALHAIPARAQRQGADLTPEVLYYGKPEAPPRVVPLRAGPLTMEYEAGDLRYIRLNDREVVRRWYAATRDRNWGTLPTALSNEKIDAQEDSFRITYDVQNKRGDIDFVWKGTIEGDKQGRITFSLDGVARTTFLRNRIGFCLLHPIRECPGSRARVEQADGTVIEGVFPKYISPQAPFPEMKSIAHEVTPGVWCKLAFSGDIFEMEDQRNWVDASFKTFCTPLRIPYPVEVQEGTRIAQSVTLSLEGPVPDRQLTKESSRVAIEILSETRPVPQIGLGAASHGQPLTMREQQRLKALGLAHLRLDMTLADPDHIRQLQQAAGECAALGVPLEAALFLSQDAEQELESLIDQLKTLKPRVARWLVFHAAEKSTSQKWISLARERLKQYDPDARVYSGTNAYFTELNRERPPAQVSDGVVYSLNPQVHAFDNRSLIETLEAHVSTIESARQFTGNLPLAISPVTFLPRFNPNATGKLSEATDSLPAQVDVRQMSLFGAGWTLGSLKYIAESGVESVTYYETTGWRGVMETAAGLPLPDQFRSLPGSVFPLYHVLADVGEFRDGQVVPTRSADPLRVESLLLTKGDRRRMLVANLTEKPMLATISGLGSEVQVRRLNADNARAAVLEPEQFRRQPPTRSSAQPQAEIQLAPYEIVRLDVP